ncbi:putative leader peptide [Embleya sp. NBC_00896]
MPLRPGSGTLCRMYPVRLVARLHVDLRRVATAICPDSLRRA